MNATKAASRKRKEKVPDYLIYEVMNGKPYYRKGYKDVLNKTKTLEEIMGSSTLQFVLINYLLQIIYKFIDHDKFYVATNKAGLHLSKNNNLANDIAIYSSAVLTPDKIMNRYADVPPQVVIEIDTKIEIENSNVAVNLKTKKLLDFGVERVIWIFTDNQKVMVATLGEDWLIKDWNKDVEIMHGNTFNIANYLQEKGIKIEVQN